MTWFQRLALMFSLVLMSAVSVWAQEGEPLLPPRPVASEIVETDPGRALTFLGEVSSRNEADLAFPIPGTMVQRLVDGGAVVLEGDAVAALDPTEYTSAMRRAQAAVIVAASGLRTATDAADRARTLLARGVDSQARLEQAEQAQATAQALVDQANAAVISAGQNLDDTTLLAPRAGVISATFAEAGSELTAGQPVLRLSGIEEREVLIDMTEDQLATFAKGDVFNLALLSNSAVKATGVFTSVDPVADATTRLRRVHLQIETLLPGFRLGALIEARPGGDAGIARLTVPASAVHADSTVWVVARPADTVKRVSITTGDRFAERIVVLEGLEEGDEVVVKGIHSLSDGQIVGAPFTGQKVLE